MAAPYPQNSSVNSAFCIDDLWVANRTWQSPSPQLSNCLQKCLNFIPLIYLIVSLPLYLLFIRAHVKRYPVIKHTWLNGTQTLLCVVLSVIRFVELILLATLPYHRQIAVVDYVSPTALILTFALVSFYIQTARQHGVWTSGVLFVFWVLLLILDIVSIASTGVRITERGYIEDVPGLVLHIIHIVLVLVQLVLSTFVDTLPDEGKDSDGKNAFQRIPETRASFLSRITFWWFTSFVIRCHKEKLTTDDLWRLDQKLLCQNLTHKFQGAWRRLKRRFDEGRSVAAARPEDPAAVQLTSIPASPEPEVHEPEVHIKAPSIGGRMIFIRALAHVGGAYFLKSILFKLIFDVLQFVQPVLLKYLIAFTADMTQPVWKGFFYALLMFLFALLQSLILHEYFHRCMTTGMKFKSVIVSAVYQKALRLGSASRKESTVGEIVNLMSVDAQRFHDLMTYFNMVWSAPFQICISLYLLWQILGPSVLAGVGVMLFMMGVSAGLANFQKKLQVKQMKFKDDRMKLMNEILNGIKVLKLYAWEESFMKMVLGIRDQELRVMRHSALLNVSTSFLWRMGSYLVSLVSFAVYVMSDEKNVLDAEKAFVSLSLFNLLRFPLFALPMMISNLIQATVSVQRLAKFLLLDELDPDNVTKHKSDDQIRVENGSFSWGKGETCTLHDVNLHIKPGRLVAVVGSVGAGKSSLMSALLGEMFVQQGKVNVQGSMAYVSQQSWIQNATLRDNILFSANFDFERYCDVIDACALVSDLDVLPAGDKTEIGEKGINLSGGQKARVSLARAVYSDADVYLLDDPLSAVDAHVGKHIFDHVIGPTGLLRHKTRVLVTHGISILPKVDWVVVLCDGQVKEEGTLRDLLTHAGPCAEFIRNYLLDEEHHLEEEIELDEEGVVSTDDLINQVTTLYRDSNPNIATSLSRENLSQRGKHAASAASVEDLYKRSLKRCVSTSDDHRSSREILAQDQRVGESNQSRSQHSLHSRATSPARRLEATSKTKPENGQMTSSVRERLLGHEKDELVAKETTETGKVKYTVYMAYLRALRIPVAVAVLFVFLLVHALGTGANFWLSMWSDDVMANNGTQSPRDRDYRLGVYGAFGVAQAIATVSGGALLQLGALKAARILHKSLLTGVLRSSMSFFDTTPLGRVINRFSKDIDVLDSAVMMKMEHLITCFMSLISTLVVVSYSTPAFLVAVIPLLIVYVCVQQFYVTTSRQLKRLESTTRSPIYSHFGETLTGTSCIRAFGQTARFMHLNNDKVDVNNRCLYPSNLANRWLAMRLEFVGHIIVLTAAILAVTGRESLSPGTVGLSISYALNITQTLNWLVRMSCDIETDIVAVERIEEYSELEPEAPWHIPDQAPPASWPSEGRVDLDKYSVRYREGTDLVLRQVDVKIEKGEKIGVVGRTGAGKSSMTLGLLRVLEAAEGSIIIDGRDISKMGLHDLRSKITIIPQDPVLFSGTLRMNLDPFNDRSDAALWSALELSHLKHYVSGLKDGLEHQVSEGGENMSVGQRQLMCLARALLRKTRILILDEATAAVDLETDDLIQATIRTEFAECTVIIIAHRLNTIMDCDRILVLDTGRVKELATPAQLLADKTGLFYSLARAAGVVASSD